MNFTPITQALPETLTHQSGSNENIFQSGVLVLKDSKGQHHLGFMEKENERTQFVFVHGERHVEPYNVEVVGWSLIEN